MALLPHQIKIMADRWHWKEGFPDLCDLVATTVANAETTRELKNEYQAKFFDVLRERKFSPNTPTWINAGRDVKGSLSACFVYNIEDTMESILDSSRWMGMVQKFGGGTGFDLSALRERGKKIRSTHGKACGPIAVLKHLAATSQMVTQGGVRDGANMAVLSVYHPDVMDFISLKAKESKYMLEIPREYAQIKIDRGDWTLEQGAEYIEYCRLNGLYQLFNVSVAVDEHFMNAVGYYVRDKAREVPLENCEEGNSLWDHVLPCGKTIAQVWEAIVEQAWTSGDPGILFLDRAKEIGSIHSPLELRATNPCGEQYLPHNGSCNLGSINLAKIVTPEWMSCRENPTLVGIQELINWEDFKKTIFLGVRFLDNVVEINHHADPGIDAVNKAERRIGLGVMGWADMLFKLGVCYDSQLAIDVIHTVGSYFQQMSHEASVQLAVEKGAFPLYSQVADCKLPDGRQLMPAKPRRNATVTTIAPTGTISLVAGCFSGIEPHFMMAYNHGGLKESGGLGLVWASETLKEFCDKPGDGEGGEWFKYYDQQLRELGWKPANEISIEWHIQHQAVWQQYIDNSISKTLNLPNSASREEVAKAYLLAYKSGCKGSTVYRDGCKPFQPLNAPKDSEKLSSEPVSEAHVLVHRPPVKAKRPRWVTSETAKIETAEGDLYITITKDDRGMPFEIFAGLGKSGTSTSAGVEALCRTVSLGLRYGIGPVEYVRQLRGIKSIQHGMGPNAIFSIPDAIGQMLEEYMVRTFGEDWAAEEGWTSQNREEEPAMTTSAPLPLKIQISEACPKCGAQLVHAEGCHGGTCYVCGYSKCS